AGGGVRELGAALPQVDPGASGGHLRDPRHRSARARGRQSQGGRGQAPRRRAAGPDGRPRHGGMSAIAVLRTWAAALGALLLVALAAPGPASASEPLWALLKGGGRVVLMRHAITTPGVGDPPGMRLDDCATQRNLTDEGRRHARQAGEALRARGVVVEQVLTSP